MAKKVVRRRSTSERLLSRCAKVEGGLTPQGRPKVALGIDPSLTNLGVSLCSTDDHITSLFRPKGGGSARLHEIRGFIRDLVQMVDTNFELCEIVMEGYSFASKAQHHKIGEGGGAIKLGLLDGLGVAEKRAYPTLVSPNSLKKYVLGAGSGKKNQMLMGAYKKWGVEFSSDDMADAYSLGRLGVALLCGQTDFRYEEEVVTALERNTEWKLRPET